MDKKLIYCIAKITMAGIFFLVLFGGLLYLEGIFFRFIGLDFYEATSITYKPLLGSQNTIPAGFILLLIFNLLISAKITGGLNFLMKEKPDEYD